MWVWCDGRWIQVDTTETLFLECIWQYLDSSCRQLSKLPLLIRERHPLNVSFGDAIHGKQMRTA